MVPFPCYRAALRAAGQQPAGRPRLVGFGVLLGTGTLRFEIFRWKRVFVEPIYEDARRSSRIYSEKARLHI